jgi:citronellol/citronellal dehydrogenase
MNDLRGRTLFITGASRGIGLAIALRAARDGANIAIAAKSSEPNPKLRGTIHTAAAAIEREGGRALAIQCDIRDEAQVEAAVARTVERFGAIDALINNASAIWLRGTLETPMKRFDLMQQVNARGTFLCARACLPHLLRAPNPHILTLAPPPDLDPRWWAPHVGYTLAKMGMSFVTLGLAEEFRRRPDIVADAAHAVLTTSARELTGRFLIDEDMLRERGVDDFTRYAVDPQRPPLPDLFLRDTPSRNGTATSASR